MDWFLVFIVVTAVTARFFAVLDWNSYSPDSLAALHGDEPGYANTARELLLGRGFTWPGRVPGYPALLAIMLWVANQSFHAVRILQCLFGIPVVLLTFQVARRLVGLRAARMSAVMAAFTLPLVRQPVSIMSEVVFTPVLLLVGLTAVRAFERPKLGRFAWLGFTIGLSILFRPTLILFPAAVACAIFFVTPWHWGLRYSTACLGLALLPVLPWLIHNRVKHRATILATSNAFLWQGSPEYYHLTHEQGYTYQRIWGNMLYGNNLPDPSSVSGDRYWTHRAIVSIRSEPLTYIRFAFEKVFTYWVGDSSADWNNGAQFGYDSLVGFGYSPSMAIEVIIARAIPIVALFAIAASWPLRQQFMPIYLLLGYTTLFHAATHAEARLSEPCLPFLFILVAGAVAKISDSLAPVTGP